MKNNKRLLSLILAMFMLLTAPAYTYVPVTATAITTINTNTENSLTSYQRTKISIKTFWNHTQSKMVFQQQICCYCKSSRKGYRKENWNYTHYSQIKRCVLQM